MTGNFQDTIPWDEGQWLSPGAEARANARDEAQSRGLGARIERGEDRELNQVIGDRVRTARKIRGLGVGELGNASGVKGYSIYRYEKGEQLPTLLNLIALAQTLRVTVGWLIDEPGAPGP